MHLFFSSLGEKWPGTVNSCSETQQDLCMLLSEWENSHCWHKQNSQTYNTCRGTVELSKSGFLVLPVKNRTACLLNQHKALPGVKIGHIHFVPTQVSFGWRNSSPYPPHTCNSHSLQEHLVVNSVCSSQKGWDLDLPAYSGRKSK